jgi:hypothetical protein
MSDARKVGYLKIDRGRFFYQRRVPKHLQADLREKMWLRPCGDVTYSKAVQMIVTWAEEHDSMIADLENPEKCLAARAKVNRAIKQQMRDAYAELGLPRFFQMTESVPGEKQFYTAGAPTVFVKQVVRRFHAASLISRDADFGFGVEPDGSGGLPVAGFA